MSRSGYVDPWECDGDLNLYRGAVDSAIRGARGQRFLLDLVRGLDRMKVKELLAGGLASEDGAQVCAVGCLIRWRFGDRTVVAMRPLGGSDEEQEEMDIEVLARLLDAAPCLVAETAYLNDESNGRRSPVERHAAMRAWAYENLTPESRAKLEEK